MSQLRQMTQRDRTKGTTRRPGRSTPKKLTLLKESIMNAKTLIATALIALWGAQAMAAEQPKTREQVKAEVAAARADGSLERQIAASYGVFDTSAVQASGKTRAEVQQEVQKARANGTLDEYAAQSYG